MNSIGKSPRLRVSSEPWWGIVRISSLASLLCTFGPYINASLGLRLEQVVIYISFLLLLLTRKVSMPRSPALLAILLCFVILLFIPLMSLDEGNYSRLSLVVAQFENYLQAPVVFLIFIATFQRASHNGDHELFSRFADVILYMLAINTIFSLYIMSNPSSELLRIFSGAREISESNNPFTTGMTTTELNVSAGRVTGVFGQVFAGGYAYSLGLFLWIYNYKGTGKTSWVPYTLLLMILMGGMFSASKVFLVLGLPLFLVSLGMKRVWLIGSLIAAIILLALFVNPVLIDLFETLNGLVYIFRLIDLDAVDIFTVYTSGRFSEESIIIDSITRVLSISPLVGLGYGSIETSDFSLNEVISLGGLIGLLAYLCLHISVAMLALNIKKGAGRTLYLQFLVITFLTSLSAPVITANRISVFVWLIVAWALFESLKNTSKALRSS
jgi:hypothetical protein